MMVEQPLVKFDGDELDIVVGDLVAAPTLFVRHYNTVKAPRKDVDAEVLL